MRPQNNNVFQEQAQYYRNIPLIERDVVASVHLENAEDKRFCDAILQRHHPGRYYFISQSRSARGQNTSGCEQCLNYRSYLSKDFFVFIDSDMRYVLQQEDIDALHFVCQTYTYSWENHYCESKALQKRYVQAVEEKGQTVCFDFVGFLDVLSKLFYDPFALFVKNLKDKSDTFTITALCGCIPRQCHGDELNDNGKPLLHRIQSNLTTYQRTAEHTDLNAAKDFLRSVGIDETNVYLHLRGHNLYDLVCYIGRIVCRKAQVSFTNDVLLKDIPTTDYWEIRNIGDDIKTILQ